MFGSLATMVPTMMFSFDSISQTTWSTCILQVNNPVQILSCSTFENLTPLVSRRYCGIAPPLMNSSWCDTSHRFCQSTGSALSLTENTEYLLLAIPFLDVVAIRWHPLKPLDMMCRGHHQHFYFSHVSIELITRNTILAPR